MDNNLIQYLAPGALASAVLAFVVREWDSIYDLGVKIYDTFTRNRIDAPHEVNVLDLTLDLRDPQGKRATFQQKMKVRFLQDYVIAFHDHAWGDGNAMAEYAIAPGQVVDQYREGDRWNILVSLRRTMNRGESEEFNITRTVENGFTKKEEWVQAETWLPTHHLRLKVRFPKQRPCKKIWLIERSRHRTTPISLDDVTTLPDGRTEIAWERPNPRRNEIFTLKWEW